GTMTKDATTTESVGFFEKLGDFFSAIGEWVSRTLTRLFGSSNERYIRSLGYIRATSTGAAHTVIPGSLLDQVNQFEPKMREMSAEEMRGMTVRFRERLAQGATLD